MLSAVCSNEHASSRILKNEFRRVTGWGPNLRSGRTGSSHCLCMAVAKWSVNPADPGQSRNEIHRKAGLASRMKFVCRCRTHHPHVASPCKFSLLLCKGRELGRGVELRCFLPLHQSSTAW